MRKAQILIGAIALCTSVGLMFSFKAKRMIYTFYMCDSTNPNPVLRLCTKATLVTYTTDIADAVPGARGIIQTKYYTTGVAGSGCNCPSTTIYSAD